MISSLQEFKATVDKYLDGYEWEYNELESSFQANDIVSVEKEYLNSIKDVEFFVFTEYNKVSGLWDIEIDKLDTNGDIRILFSASAGDVHLISEVLKTAIRHLGN